MKLDLLQAIFRPRMSEIDEEHETKKQEEHSSSEGDVSAPDLEEDIGYEEGQNQQTQPTNDLWSPESILDCRSSISCGPHTEEDDGKKSVEGP